MQHVFIIGCRKVARSHGGYETFVDKLTEYHQNNTALKYHVACKNAEKPEFECHNAHCYNVKVPNIGAAQGVYYDFVAAIKALRYIKKKQIEKPVIYILTCRIGPFAGMIQKAVHKFGGEVFLNPDGHEWKRAKWNVAIRKYWKISERLLVKYADLVICDSKNIEVYIQNEYKKYSPKTVFIAYGAEIGPSVLSDTDARFTQWMQEHTLVPGEYYLAMGRFVPENNFETIIREFMRSNTHRDLAVMATENKALLEKLEKKLHFSADPRIKFVGAIYEQELNRKIRENAYGHIHGHEVGGTNPSLLEALNSTNLNLLIDIGFSHEVAEDAALYWNKTEGSLSGLINETDRMDSRKVEEFGKKAKKRIIQHYSWEHIAGQYEYLFLNHGMRIPYDYK